MEWWLSKQSLLIQSLHFEIRIQPRTVSDCHLAAKCWSSKVKPDLPPQVQAHQSLPPTEKRAGNTYKINGGIEGWEEEEKAQREGRLGRNLSVALPDHHVILDQPSSWYYSFLPAFCCFSPLPSVLCCMGTVLNPVATLLSCSPHICMFNFLGWLNTCSLQAVIQDPVLWVLLEVTCNKGLGTDEFGKC